MLSRAKHLINYLAACMLVLSTQLSADENPRVELKTDMGPILIELYPQKAPKTVENFLQYVNSRFYDGVIFHRVIPGFVVQTGGLTFDFVKKATKPPVVNESLNGLKNKYGTIAMARMPDPDSAASQFFINMRNNPHLDAKKKTPGYTVFGKVIDGMDVAQEITKQPRGLYRMHPEAPNVPVRVLTARQL